MKKNKALTAAISVLSLTMVSMCAIGGTFAKYTTNGNGTDTATVAKWGVKVSVTGYETRAYENADGKTADAEVSTTVDLVAPGTKGDLVKISVTGTPEVKVEVTYAATLTLTGWQVDITDDSVDNPVEYCPLVFKVGTNEFKIGSESGDSSNIEDLQNDVAAAIVALSTSFAADTELDTAYVAPSISWSWALGNASAEDTYLGNKAAEGNAPTISLSVTTTVTQVD